MSGNSDLLAAADYVVFAVVLLVSAGIGFYYAWKSRSHGTSRDFLTGGRKLSALPVSLSLTASFMSSVTVLSNPAEVYRYGAIFGYLCITYVIMVVFISEVFLPVFYRLAINSTYEVSMVLFSDCTGNKPFFFVSSDLFVSQLLYTGLVIYAPALALNQVTGMNLWGGIISTAILCTLYCALGGLKAVVWTDAVQVGFDINPLRRHTFWTLVIGGTFGWSATYGTNQAQVQRYNSCKSVTNARLALFINALGLTCTLTSSVLSGLCIYSFYKDCDPWTAGQVSSSDQLLPYLVMDILADHRGLPGLFFAAVYSASLSTVSTSINALAAVTVEDLIKPCTNLSEKKLLLISKGLNIVNLSMSVVIRCSCKNLSILFQKYFRIHIYLTVTFDCKSVLIFYVAPYICPQGGLLGLVAGLAASLCVTIGALISPSPPEMTRPLSLSTEGCNFTSGSSLNWTTALPTEPSPLTTTPGQNTDDIRSLHWHSPSYLYFVVIGCLTSVIVGVIISLLTGKKRFCHLLPVLLVQKYDLVMAVSANGLPSPRVFQSSTLVFLVNKVAVPGYDQ
uniref:Solute carrier family 5 member 8 n=1 Tax=Amphilophus citrinellus TaxID=61819 RepID=A0A3Q0RP94_AMPCI